MTPEYTAMAAGKKRRMAPRTQSRRNKPKRSNAPDTYWHITHRPLQSLVFLLPMILAYEIGTAMTFRGVGDAQHRDLAASQLLHWFFSLFGASSVYIPGAVLILVLLGWHIWQRHPWKIKVLPLFGMAAESIGLAMVLVLLNYFLHTVGNPNVLLATTDEQIQELLFSIGAGIYEELVFRLIVISLLLIVFDQLLQMREAAGVALAVILSSLFFAVSHHEPIGADAWDVQRFAFRAAAGAYLAAVFVLRGFGLAVGCHVVYDLIAFVSVTAASDS